MIIRTSKQENPFVMLDKTALNDERLSWKAKGLHAYMMSKPDHWQFYMELLEKASTDGRESLQSGFKELQRFGYVIRKPKQNEKGKLDGWEIIVTEKPTDNSENRQAVKPSDGKPVKRETRPTGKPSDGKPAASNNDSSNNDPSNNNASKKDQKSNEQPSTARQLEEAFSELWKLYPNKKGKAVAFREYKKAMKDGVEHSLIESGIKAYARTCGTDARYIMHGSTWFNQKRWDDEHTGGGDQHGITDGQHPGEPRRSKYDEIRI